MKFFASPFVALIIFFGNLAFAVEVHSARYDLNADKLFLDLSYLGGCANQEFELVLAYYRKSDPPQVGARIKQITSDSCKKPVRRTEEVNFPKELRGGGWFEILDDFQKNKSRPSIGLCIPQCKSGSENLNQSGVFKNLLKRNSSKPKADH